MNTIRVILCASAVLAATTLAHAGPAGETRRSSTISIDAHEGDGPEHFGPRQRPAAGKPYVQSTSRWTELMLKDDAVVMQLTDYGMKQIGEPQGARDKDEGFLGNMLKTMALSGVRQLLDHSLALALADMRSALVRRGEVVLVTCQGKEVFNKVKINDQVQTYPQDKAEEFVKNINLQREQFPACRT
ncbi:hypothetical protein [Massilia sp.]|uniref:hypothetical protein n=1 Tax=Massilia sp. TaxID=1882437 RepID=UPI00352BF12D